MLGPSGKLPASIGAVGPGGPQGASGPAGARGPKGDAGEPATSLWAAVRADGALVQGNGVVSVTKEATGQYAVTFTQDVSSCAVLADQTSRIVRASAAEATGGAVVKVITYVPSGTFPYQDGAFAVAVFC